MSILHFSSRFCRAVVAVVIGLAGAASVRAQTTVIHPNGTTTVHNANGTTTHITNGGIVTTGRVHKPRRIVVRPVRTVRTVRTVTHVRPITMVGGSFALAENARRITVNAKNGSVTISGNANNVTITGTCRRLAVTGNNNVVLASRVGEIATPGNNNTVVWRTSSSGGGPRITENGSGNSISHRR